MGRYSVDSSDEGSTSIPPKVIERALRARLSRLDGARRVSVEMGDADAHITVVAANGIDGDSLRRRAEEALGYEFWIDLGMADMGYELTIESTRRRSR